MVETDLISRQQAIDILSLGAEIFNRVLDDMDVVGIDREKYSYGLKLIESNIEDIKELPSALSEQKKGYWIYHLEWETDGECGYECSECGMGSEVDYNYCMNCGTDMRGDKYETN